MNWLRHSSDVIVLEGLPFYIVRYRMPPRDGNHWYYNAWHGDVADRSERTYVTAGDSIAECKKACEAKADLWSERA